MSPIKLSIVGAEGGSEEHVDLDDDLETRLRKTIEAHPGLTVSEAVRQGIEHVIEHGPRKQHGH